MKQTIIYALLSFLLLFSANTIAQVTVEGQVKDTSGINDVELTSIVILGAKDSILKAHTRTDAQGKFKIELKEQGDYILLASHPVFAIYTDGIKVNANQVVLEPIALTTKAELMETVLFTDDRAIMIKGDTTIYSADSFNVRQYATVDELLKKLPGIEVSKDGKIKAYGKDVQKMFVDGEEFFSDDPSVVAKTLQASSIDKVKVYDDKSQEAKNTGIDDGEKVKTINLTLKEDAKKGLLGSVYGGYAPTQYHEYSGKLQYFKGKRKIAAYVNGGNTNSDLMDVWESISTYGTRGDINYEEDGSISYISNISENSKDGFPNSINTGINLTDKYWNDKWKANINGGYNNYSLETSRKNINRYIMPDTQYINETSSEVLNKNAKYRIGTNNTINIDSFKSLRVGGNFNFMKTERNSVVASSYKDIVGTLINESTTNNSSESDNNSGRLFFYYNQKLKKKGRSYNIGGSYNTSNVKELSFMESNNRLVLLDSNINFNQRKVRESSSNQYEFSAAYTEPLWKEKLFLILNYKFNRAENTNNLRTYDINNGGPETYNSNFSNDFDFNRTSNSGGIAFRYKVKKFRSSIGLDANETKFEQVNRIHAILNREYSNFNLFPKADASYEFNTYTSLNFRYNGNTIQPTIDQLQPLVVNSDPTNIRIGNDALQQSFTNNFNINYHTYSVLKNRYAYFSFNYITTSKPISMSQTLDETGIRVYQYVNTKNSQNMNLWGMYHTAIAGDLKGSVGMNGNINTNYSFNNGIEAKNDYYTINPNLGLTYEKDTTFNVNVRFSPAYNNSVTSIRTDVNNKFWTYTTSLNLSYYLPFEIEFKTNFNWVVRPQIDAAIQGNNVFLWNAELSKRFLKDRSLKASIYCYDILNQNVGFNFYQSGISTSESSWNVIKQYFMFGLTWNFNSMKKKGAQQENESSFIID